MKSTILRTSCIALVLALTASMVPAQLTAAGIGFGSGFAVGVPIPSAGTGGATGGNTNPDNLTVVTYTMTNDNLVIADLDFSLDVTHSYCGDLIITLSHCGVTVTLANGDNSSNNLGGLYTFDDEAAGPFAGAPTTTPGTLDPGRYTPTMPLSAFDGLSSSGVWTLTIYDQFGGDTGTLNGVGDRSFIATTKVSDLGLPLPVPPTGTGGGAFGDPSNTFSRTLFIPNHGRIGNRGLGVRLRMDHTFCGDLRIQLSHGSVSRYITNFAGGSANLVNTDSYHFNDSWAPWPPAPVAGELPTNVYAPQESFAAFNNMDMFGAWTLTIYDAAGADSGNLHEFELQIGANTYQMGYGQPFSTGPLSINNLDGIPNSFYFNAFRVFAPSSTPNGWFYGLDVTLSEIVNQFNQGYPYIGNLDNCGDAFFTQGGFVPPGIPINSVGVLLAGSAGVIQSSAPASYVTF
ncbi:MAG: proprotein convertase P-domain-containing protein [Planctomycetes bacterium]|nr:proprotein convertase P-domain-containing protein [Planctomycetota bacterium]